MKFLSLQEVANRLDVSYQSVQRLTQSGKLPSSKLNSMVRISEEDLENYYKQNRRSA